MIKIINQLVLDEYKIVDVLSNHFGDGSIYVPANDDSYDYCTAKELGFISDDGYITRSGKQLISKYLH